MKPYLLASLALLPVAGRAQSDPVSDSRAHYRQAVQAYEAHDIPGFLEHARQAQMLRPTHGGALYALASAYALNGDPADALAALDRFAALGYTADVAADSDFVSLRGTGGFDTLIGRLETNRKPLVRSTVAFTLDEREFLPEGVTYDPASRSFFVGSVRQRKIVRVDPKGRATELVGPARDGLWAPLGLGLDSRRHALWVAAAGVPQMTGYNPADSGRSGIFRYDLRAGKLTGRYLVPPDGSRHTLGDLTVTRAGDVYATDSRAPVIWRVRARGDTVERFLESPLLLSAQGLALSPDERTLFVADYARGILAVDLAARDISLLPASDSVLALGIDGVYFHEGTLIGIQNGVTPHRVVRLWLSPGRDRVLRSEVLERAHPRHREPTLGTLVGSDLYYVANSQWERFGDDGTITEPATLEPPVILRLRL